MDAYRVQLRVRSSNLRVGRGPAASVRRTSDEVFYLIGSADDAFLCCRHPEIRPHHCWIVVHSQGVQARCAEGAIEVNGRPVEDRLELASGDNVTVGPLRLRVQFQAATDATTQAAADPRRALAEASVDRVDPVEDEISDWLINQDEADRRRRLRDARGRQVDLDELPRPQPPATQEVVKSDVKSKTPPPPKKPGKLPPRPAKPAAKSSDSAAEGALKHIFTRQLDKNKTPEKK